MLKYFLHISAVGDVKNYIEAACEFQIEGEEVGDHLVEIPKPLPEDVTCCSECLKNVYRNILCGNLQL